MNGLADVSQNDSSINHVSPEARLHLLKTVRSTLALVEYYDSLSQQPEELRRLLLSNLLEAVAELNTLTCSAQLSSPAEVSS